MEGAEPDDVAGVLGDHDAEHVSADISGLGPGEAVMARSLFASLGMCSTDEPADG